MHSSPFHSCCLSGSAGAFAVALFSPMGLVFLRDVEVRPNGILLACTINSPILI